MSRSCRIRKLKHQPRIGKVTIYNDHVRLRRRFVQSLGGRYITAGDVGTSADDLDVVGRTTSHVLGRNAAAGGYGDSGAMTAFGASHALRTGAEARFGTSVLTGRTVGVEGMGKVGHSLIELLLDADATVMVSPDTERQVCSGSLGPAFVDAI